MPTSASTSADPFAAYFAALQSEYQSGRATEHSHRPALKTLLESLVPGIRATNEPKRVECGAPDYVITRSSGHGALTIGYIEAKDIGKLTSDIERTDQMKRYLGALPNLVLTDYLEFRWYTDGSRRQVARLATVGAGNNLARERDGGKEVAQLLDNFLRHQPEQISKPQDLALRMARLTHIIRDIIIEAFQKDQATPLLKGWRKAFADVLITDLDQPHIEKTAEFADMFAQTLAYGLFSARVMDTTPESFTRQEAQYLIPPTNPFLRRFFYEISGPDLDNEPYGGFVDDLAALLEQTDMQAVLADFGKRTRQEDPVVHFYETFLAAYDPKLRESRGVYYTPEPVVSYIVRSVDYLLKTRFGCADGLADSTKVTVANTDPSLKVKGKSEARKTMESHRVLLLDPACGTGTFLYSVIDHIRAQFMKQGNAGMWSDYVREHLLPRLFGFELLMAPYAVAHFKLGLQLAGRDLPEDERAAWAYDFASGERLGVYLTNTLEGPHEYTGLPLFTQFLANETDAANRIKRDLPIMVVLGNPPYSGHSANKGQWIHDLLRGKDIEAGKATGNYFQVDGKPLGEKNPKWLNDDYVKFIRFSQWRIERSGAGILAFISNNGYLDNPTFRGMRQSLMQTFSDIYILDLHGNSKKQERSPDGTPDQNVFDIQQGVAIGIFVKEPGKAGPAQVHHTDLWGLRESKDKQDGKYPWLFQHDVADTNWGELSPQPPFYLFTPQNTDLLAEYGTGWKIGEAMPVNSVGVVTGQDKKTIAFTYVEAKQLALQSNLAEDVITPILYRPFDKRWVTYDSTVVTRQRLQVMHNLLLDGNIAIITSRLTKGETYEHTQVTRNIAEVICMSPKTSNNGFVFPLYLYPNSTKKTLFDTEEPSNASGGRRPNLNPAFIADMEQRLGLVFVPDGHGDLQATFGPEDVFNYIYAVFHSPTYRARYAEFLKMDFPRLPLTSDAELFRKLCDLGGQLVGLHLMEKQAPTIASYPMPGDNTVEKVSYTGPGQGSDKGRVWINKNQYFEGVPPEVWEFHIGGYQVAEKWLKDRKGLKLAYDDLEHYRRVVAALGETGQLMDEVDGAIVEWPIK